MTNQPINKGIMTSYSNSGYGTGFDETPIKPSRPSIPNRPPVPERPSEESKRKLQSVQNDMEEVKLVMVSNIDKALKRDENISEMLIKSEDLRYNANIFQRTSRVLKRKMCCENAKANMMLITVILVIICLLILIVVLSTKPWNN